MKSIMAALMVLLLAAGVQHIVADPMDAPQPNIANLPEADYQGEPVQRAQFPAENFNFKFSVPDVNNSGGRATSMAVNSNGVLGTLPGEGVSQTLLDLNPCAMNQLHVHPRGTEVAHVTKGEFLMGFLEENAGGGAGGRLISFTVSQGQSFIFPQGLPHFVQNLNCEPGQLIATFPTRDAGTHTIPTNLGKLPNSVLRAAFGLPDVAIEDLKKMLAGQGNLAFDAACLERCHM